jgi:hypothetical protein
VFVVALAKIPLGHSPSSQLTDSRLLIATLAIRNWPRRVAPSESSFLASFPAYEAEGMLKIDGRT